MKTRIIKATLAVAFIAVVGYTTYNSQKKVEMSDLAMANVEALANCTEASYDTGKMSYNAENGCHCLSCVEVGVYCNCM